MRKKGNIRFMVLLLQTAGSHYFSTTPAKLGFALETRLKPPESIQLPNDSYEKTKNKNKKNKNTIILRCCKWKIGLITSEPVKQSTAEGGTVLEAWYFGNYENDTHESMGNI